MRKIIAVILLFGILASLVACDKSESKGNQNGSYHDSFNLFSERTNYSGHPILGTWHCLYREYDDEIVYDVMTLRKDGTYEQWRVYVEKNEDGSEGAVTESTRYIAVYSFIEDNNGEIVIMGLANGLPFYWQIVDTVIDGVPSQVLYMWMVYEDHTTFDERAYYRGEP